MKITKKKLETLRDNGLSTLEIAKHFKCSVSTINNAIRAFKIPRKKSGRRSIIEK